MATVAAPLGLGRLCPRCEHPALARTDDTEWFCFSCGFREERGEGHSRGAAASGDP
ncbi:hypothetical protein [Brevibacterium oceani]|uniref:hypothetical protein n=1 Tax=Brevibacterium oceani TaxID=358099 RepID=UPI0015E6B72C|nr:hypothetical protein [Brevibacterium oceani]